MKRMWRGLGIYTEHQEEKLTMRINDAMGRQEAQKREYDAGIQRINDRLQHRIRK